MQRSAALFLAALASAHAAERTSLSPLIAQGLDVHAPSKVGPIPGVTLDSYAGLITTNASANAEAFFWYWPAASGNASAPVVVWMQGGPGSSSLFGCFAEMGPYRISAAGQPVPNPSAWTQEYNMVFLDNPRGTGYSSADVLCTEWQCYGSDFDAFIRQFLTGYGLLSNDLYITGESYGGHYVPASAYTVHTNNALGVTPLVNLKGIAVGNGFVAPLEMSGGYADIIYQAGLLSLPEYAIAQSYVANITQKIEAEDYVGAVSDESSCSCALAAFPQCLCPSPRRCTAPNAVRMKALAVAPLLLSSNAIAPHPAAALHPTLHPFYLFSPASTLSGTRSSMGTPHRAAHGFKIPRASLITLTLPSRPLRTLTTLCPL
jgi:hypothetical protein